MIEKAARQGEAGRPSETTRPKPPTRHPARVADHVADQAGSRGAAFPRLFLTCLTSQIPIMS